MAGECAGSGEFTRTVRHIGRKAARTGPWGVRAHLRHLGGAPCAEPPYVSARPPAWPPHGPSSPRRPPPHRPRRRARRRPPHGDHPVDRETGSVPVPRSGYEGAQPGRRARHRRRPLQRRQEDRRPQCGLHLYPGPAGRCPAGVRRYLRSARGSDHLAGAPPPEGPGDLRPRGRHRPHRWFRGLQHGPAVCTPSWPVERSGRSPSTSPWTIPRRDRSRLDGGTHAPARAGPLSGLPAALGQPAPAARLPATAPVTRAP